MKDYMQGAGQGGRVCIVNLDFANENMGVDDCDVDVRQLITLDDAMKENSLGPNGGLIYCMETLEANFDWLEDSLQHLLEMPPPVASELNENESESGSGNENSRNSRDCYFLFDLPGQVELYTHHGSVRRIVERLVKSSGMRLAAVNLVDSHACTDPANFVAVLLTSLATMLQVELPHVNVLSKVDLLPRYGPLPFNLEYFTDVLDLSYLQSYLDDSPFATDRFKQLNAALCDVISDHSLVSFTPLNVQDQHSVGTLLRLVHKATGFYQMPVDSNKQPVHIASADLDFAYEHAARYHDLYVSSTPTSTSTSSYEPLNANDLDLQSWQF
jgi:GPN-loop GTPase